MDCTWVSKKWTWLSDFQFLLWPMMLSIFSYHYLPSVYLIWCGNYSDILFIFLTGFLLYHWVFRGLCLFEYKFLISYMFYSIFSKSALSFHPLCTLSQSECVHAHSCQSSPALWPHGLYIAHQAPVSMGFSCKNTRVGCHFLLQGIFLT